MSAAGEGVDNLEMKIENICETPVRSKPRSLTVVVTEGCQPVQCYKVGETQLNTVSVPVPPLDKQYIKVTLSSHKKYKIQCFKNISGHNRRW